MALWEFRGTLQALFVIGLTVVSWRRGAAPERATATVLAAMVTLAWLYRLLGMPLLPGRVFDGYSNTTPAFLIIDGTALIALVAISLSANRMYPLWMAGFQLTAMSTHFVNEVAARAAPFAYAMANILPFYFMITSQMLGLWFHVRRQNRWGPYPSWRTFYDPSQGKRQK